MRVNGFVCSVLLTICPPLTAFSSTGMEGLVVGKQAVVIIPVDSKLF